MLSHSAEQRSVKIKVKTNIKNGHDQETFELIAFGRYYEKGGSFFIQYEEELEDGIIKSIVKVSEKETLILRSGAINMRMVFQRNKKLPGRYETSYGLMEIVTHTKGLSHSFELDNNVKKKGVIDILYDLKMQGSLAGTYHLEILFEEEKK